MKICLVMGTRPNFMKISSLISPLSSSKLDFFIVHTGQHYDANMSKNIISDLSFPSINYILDSSNKGEINQFSNIMMEFEKICKIEAPDLVVVPGDVNSTLACALVASKMKIKIAHLEAGLRSFDMDMPEEVNRILTDHISNFLFITEESANQNLLNEGIKKEKIAFVGNTMIDSLKNTLKLSYSTRHWEKFKLTKKKYCLFTMHRPSNVDKLKNLRKMVTLLNSISNKIDTIFPLHPRTKKFILKYKLKLNKNIILTDPLPYKEFLALLAEAKLVVTDSGGIQEETTFLGVQCVTVRDNTE